MVYAEGRRKGNDCVKSGHYSIDNTGRDDFSMGVFSRGGEGMIIINKLSVSWNKMAWIKMPLFVWRPNARQLWVLTIGPLMVIYER